MGKDALFLGDARVECLLRYLFSIHGISGMLSVLGGSIWTTVRMAQGVKDASHPEVVFNVVLSALILITGIERLRRDSQRACLLGSCLNFVVKSIDSFNMLES